VARHTDASEAAHADDVEKHVVVPRVDADVAELAEAARFLEVGVGLLDGADVVDRCEIRQELGRQVHHAARRDVVDDDGQAGGRCDRAEVQEKAARWRLVVVGRDHQHGVYTGTLGPTGELHTVGSVVGPGARDYGAASAGHPDDRAEHALFLVVAERGRLAGGPGDHQAIRAGRQQVVGKAFECGLVER